MKASIFSQTHTGPSDLPGPCTMVPSAEAPPPVGFSQGSVGESGEQLCSQPLVRWALDLGVRQWENSHPHHPWANCIFSYLILQNGGGATQVTCGLEGFHWEWCEVKCRQVGSGVNDKRSVITTTLHGTRRDEAYCPTVTVHRNPAGRTAKIHL